MTLETPIHTTRPAAPRAAPPRPRTAAGNALRACGMADKLRHCAALGDAAALLRRDDGSVAATTAAWRTLLPALAEGASQATLEQGLPGVRAACRSAEASPQRVSLGDTRQWEAQLAALDDEHLLLRVTDRRELGRVVQRQLDDREQLLFTSRVISVGEMATTLAHELNQPIGAAANLLRGLRSRLARRRSALSAEESAALERTLEQVLFASRIIARIREFTHSHQPRQARLDLAALLRASASLLDWDLRRSHAALALELPAEPVPVQGDEVMLQQVVVNLMRNALDALRSDPPAAPQLALRLLVRTHEVELQVCDNGCGLDDDAAARLFVPFASTKPSGMGIGLSICRSFVELHQGRLWFSRNAERGTTFHVSLPRAAATAPSA